MLMNRHFFIILFSIFFIGVIFWWQKPVTAVSAMAGADYHGDPYQMIKSYWRRMDYRQFNLTREMISDTALERHYQIQKNLTDNPLLSIRNVDIEATMEKNTLLARVTSGSVIDPKTEVSYLMHVGESPQGFLITSIKTIP
ncbi:MAG: hypothetical protein AWM53_00351 [Candidatus Dichloromethanomonas elyunquensis]|nr:MAG: hypothetical protein AWM53_00351 [Candidatus Dichloromethanomonas elyunquensis]